MYKIVDSRKQQVTVEEYVPNKIYPQEEIESFTYSNDVAAENTTKVFSFIFVAILLLFIITGIILYLSTPSVKR